MRPDPVDDAGVDQQAADIALATGAAENADHVFVQTEFHRLFDHVAPPARSTRIFVAGAGTSPVESLSPVQSVPCATSTSFTLTGWRAHKEAMARPSSVDGSETTCVSKRESPSGTNRSARS